MMEEKNELIKKITELKTEQEPNWCPGCGDFGIQIALKNAIGKNNLEKEKVVITTGIGCGSKINHWINTYGFHTLHGRPLPIATGIHLTNPELTNIVVAGDGDTLGIGIGHFIHSMRRNLDITMIVQNNQVYGLTKGQASPTSLTGQKGATTPQGKIEEAINGTSLALISGATFVARGFSGDVPELTELISQGINHKGFSLIEVMQPCVTFHKDYTYQWYRERIEKINETHDKQNKLKAIELSEKWEDKILTGIYYQIQKPTYYDEIKIPNKESIIKKDYYNTDISDTLKEFY